jgi:hypothetical protein
VIATMRAGRWWVCQMSQKNAIYWNWFSSWDSPTLDVGHPTGEAVQSSSMNVIWSIITTSWDPQ